MHAVRRVSDPAPALSPAVDRVSRETRLGAIPSADLMRRRCATASFHVKRGLAGSVAWLARSDAGRRSFHVKHRAGTGVRLAVARSARSVGYCAPSVAAVSIVVECRVRRARDLRPISPRIDRSMTLLLAAVGATVAALLELTVGPYLRVGDAQPHLVLVARHRRHDRGRSRGRARLGLRRRART